MKVEHTEGCVTVVYERTSSKAEGTWDIEVRSQGDTIKGPGPQSLVISTDIAVRKLILALSKVMSAKNELSQ